MISFSNDSAGLTIGIDPLLIKYLDGHVDESPPCIGWFKTQSETLHSYIFLQGFSLWCVSSSRPWEACWFIVWQLRCKQYGAAFLCMCVKGFTIYNIVPSVSYWNTVRVVSLTLSAARELEIVLPLSLLVTYSSIGEIYSNNLVASIIGLARGFGCFLV